MERLTRKSWRNLDPWEMCGQDNYCKRGCHEQGGCTKGCIVPRIYARLAAYEDTGLEPEQVMELKSFTQGGIHKVDDGWKHVQDLLQAEQDGRLVVLPCKFGDSLYRTRRFKRGSNWKKEAVHILSTTLTMNNVANVLFGDVMGKTVFLTREEAEAAMKGGEG